MRRTAILSLLCACAACGGGGNGSPAGTFTFCQYQSSLRIVPGFVLTVDADGNMSATDDYGFTAAGDAVQDWIDFHAFGPEQPGTECVVLPPELLVGREVYDYSLGDFVLLETGADVTAFLNR